MFPYKNIFYFLIEKSCVLKKTKAKGMTLLEVIVAISVFAFMFVFIAQITKQSHRQVRKIKRDVHSSSSLSNILDLIRQDFQGVGYLLDTNKNLNIQFPIEEDKPFSLNENANLDKLKTSKNESDKTVLPVLLSPHFIFQGEEDEIEFSSYSFLNTTLDNSSAQWVKIRYYIQDCDSLTEDSRNSCLIRSVSRYWNPREEEEEETLVLLRGLNSLDFSYSNKEDLLDHKWEKEWKLKNSSSRRNSSLDQIQQLPFPSIVKMEMEKGDRKHIFFFPISSSYLKDWNPQDKDYPGFPKWSDPKKNTGKKSSLKNRQFSAPSSRNNNPTRTGG